MIRLKDFKAERKVFIFDFDGTICDSYEAAMRSINDHSDSFGYRKADPSEWAALRELTMQEVLKSLGISSVKLPFVVSKIRKALKSEMDRLQAFEGIQDALEHLRKNGHSVGVLSSNSEENILYWSKKHGITFDFIYSGSSIFGKDRVIKKALKNLNIPAANVIYVGDETRDIEASRSAGVQVIAVTWGYNTKKLLQNHRPDFLLDLPSELKRF
jgi:HAD superfamily hydrolase (TIGR01662 family)